MAWTARFYLKPVVVACGIIVRRCQAWVIRVGGWVEAESIALCRRCACLCGGDVKRGDGQGWAGRALIALWM